MLKMAMMRTITIVARAMGRTMISISCCLSLAERTVSEVSGQLGAGVFCGTDCEGSFSDSTETVVVVECRGIVP